MENKTALMQLDEWIENGIKTNPEDADCLFTILMKIRTEFIDVERQQIEDAFNEGEANRRMDGDNFTSAEDYYKNKYEDHDKAGN